MTRAGLWRIGQLAFTAVLIALLWSAADGPEIIHLLSQAEPLWLLAAVAVLICQTALSALRWKVTAAHLGQTLRLPHAIKEYFMSQVVNQALPGAVVGDAARAVRARAQAGLAVATQAVVFERLAGQIAMFLTMAGAFAVTYLSVGGLEWPMTYAAPIGTAVAIGCLIAALIAVGLWFPAMMGAKLSGWMRPFYTALLSRQALPAQIGLGVSITLCNLTAFGLCAWAVGVSLSLAAILAIVPVILFSMLIPFTVSGWGIREGAAAVLLPLAGTTASEGVAASVMFGIAMLLAVVPGLIALVLK
ncbi:uncharacterized protein (TIRG00374 family) [Yoonia maricola]|uniref:Uncharacterized protein (TIRG00374 family) n=1 Tax=Yoonia maricola TaxID=420999 RepID=A0A2M8W0H3_9RHOB|nr:lysylphosphatidylglycerol synthase transmembrane domain-containing protein [Yoonia maricola]PJI84424.1 uncharacterized protein (TIRG00374 family) [Yoonia maricola]